jgi:AcrR family transcriptional regulator
MRSNLTDDIRRAATDLCGEVGADFTLDELAARTGLSRATLYRRIGSKKALLKSLAADKLIRLDTGIEARVLDAARAVVAEHGFHACTMQQIATEAGIGIATLYRRFRDKQNLLRRLMAVPASRPMVRQVSTAGKTGFEQELQQLIEIGLRYGQHNRDAARIVLSATRAENHHVEPQRQGAAGMVRYMRKHQDAGALRRDVPAADLAMMLNGLIMQYALFAPAYLDRPLDVEADGITILSLFLNAARNPQNQ